MENLIEAIRTALLDDAPPDARDAGLTACRKILAVLEATTAAAPEPAAATTAAAPAAATEESQPGAEPATATPPSTPQAPTSATSSAAALPFDASTVATLVASLGKLPPEQLLDLAITRLRAALPPNASVSTSAPLRFQLLPLHHLERSK